MDGRSARDATTHGLAGGCVEVAAPGKINLFLGVRGRRPDGYHEVATVLQTIGIRDVLRCGLVGLPGRGHHPSSRRLMRVRLTHDAGPEVPDGADNLVLRAAAVLGLQAGILDEASVPRAAARAWAAGRLHDDASGEPSPLTLLSLRKSIPVAGGMAGGSADAAAALLGLNALWGLGLARDELRVLAAQLGSDVPFCVVGGTALATGRGVDFVQVLCRSTFTWVVCRAAEVLPTAAVYEAWDARCTPGGEEPDAVLAALRTGDAEALGAALHNDLEPAAFSLLPRLEVDRDALLDAGALGAVVSGSGPTLLALCTDRAGAEALAARVAPRFVDAVVAESPADGVRLSDCS